MYQVFVIDPPWPQRKGGLRKVRAQQNRALNYSTLSVEDIFQLLDCNVFLLAASPHAAFLWTVDKFLRAAEDEMARRQYRLHARLVWDKENGVAPAFSIRFAHEYLLWLYKPTFMPVADSARGRFTTVIRARSREHSRKPDEAYDIIAALYPEASRIDVFSREKRPGWDQYGNECNYFDGGGV